MRVQCIVCRLSPEKLAEINAALRGAVSLRDISERTGISRSSLHRHYSKHIARPVPASLSPGSVAEVMAPSETLPTFTAEVLGPVTAEPPAIGPSPTPTKARFLERIELLWGESLDGLEAAKEPTVLSRPDGSTITIAGGDLRARAAFLRVARDVLELQGEATGDLQKGQSPNMIGGVMIVSPPWMPDGSKAPTVIIGIRQH